MISPNLELINKNATIVTAYLLLNNQTHGQPANQRCKWLTQGNGQLTVRLLARSLARHCLLSQIPRKRCNRSGKPQGRGPNIAGSMTNL